MSLDTLALLGGFVSMLLAAATLPGTIELLLLTTGGLLRGPRRHLGDGSGVMYTRGRVGAAMEITTPFRLAVVVPAHNEEAVIQRCLQSLYACDKTAAEVVVVVVADNCTDRTAERAAETGARVLVRCEPEKCGKGYALAFAFDVLHLEGFNAVLVVDADTVVEPNLTAEFCRLFAMGADAVQCRYGVRNPEASLRTRLMHVALLAFNVLRPRGCNWWGFSAGLLGNGFGLTEETLRAVPYDARSVVEDLEYHLRLVQAGRRVQFADATTVRADMPAAGPGVETQRARWEGGRFGMMRDMTPTLARAVLAGRSRLLEPLLDLLLLPLAFHVLLLCCMLLSSFPLVRIYALSGLAVVALHLGVALYVGGGMKDVLALAAAPFYMAWKLRMVGTLLRGAKKDMQWVRTTRENASGEKL
jgi:cellulose synthase/poly-beta-1,6-N-acetylglucosamine synthase-like glycosyltransferase